MTQQQHWTRGLAGKRALITGAAGGIARATGLRFARDGAAVALTDLNLEGAQEAARAVTGEGGKAVAIQADVTDGASVKAMMQQAADALGGIDILVTCAGGYFAHTPFEELTEEEWNHVVALNLNAVFLCCHAVLPYMKPNKWGRIINLGSLAGRSTSVGTSPAHYAAAKAGVAMMTQYLAKDMAPFGITANTVAPGTTNTPRVDKVLTPEKRERFTAMTPMGRLAESDDIADVIAFLAGEDSRYMTGATLDVNGGRLMLV